MRHRLLLLLFHALTATASVCANSGSFTGAVHKPHALAPVVEAADPLGALRHEPEQVKVRQQQQQRQQQHTTDHVITEVRVLSPVDGSVVKCPIHVQYNLVVTSFEQMQAKYAHSKACVEIDRELLVRNASHCYLLENLGYLLTDLGTGVHSLRVLIMDMSAGGGSEEEAVGSKQQQQPISSYSNMVQASKEVYFTVVDETEFEEYKRQQLQLQRDKYRLPPPEHDDLVQWAATQSSQSHDNSQSHTTIAAGTFGDLGDVNSGDPAEEEEPLPFIVIGIKTSVLHGFAQRQGIRDSWASKTALHRSVRVFFLGCRPTFSSQDDRVNQETLEAAIETEKRVFKGDLLTQELDCDDSYYHLVDKVKEFMHFATTKFPSAAYMMITDDDAYVRSHELVDLILLRDGGWPRERLYAGHVSHDKGTSLTQPERDPGHKNHLSVDQYPLQELPPFTYGCHFVVSSDCARFIGKNRRRLRGLAGLDDVSVALWLLAMQVHPRNVAAFNHLDSAPCRENFVSFADLSPSAMRIVHSNLNTNKPFCRGFDRSTWRKSSTRVFRSGVKFSTTVVRTHDNQHTHVFTDVTSETASVGWSFWYFPAIERFENLFPELCLNVKHHVLPSGFECASFADGLRNHIRDVIQTEVAARRIDAAHLELWAHNLQLVGVRSPTITAVYSTSAAFSKSMIECLLSVIYPQNPIRVIDEATYQEQRSKTQISKSPDVFVFSVLDGGPC